MPRTLQTIGCKACESLNEVLTHDEYCRWDNVIEPEFSLQDSPCHGNPLKGCKVTTLLKSIKKEELGVNSQPTVKCRGCSTPNKFRDHHESCQYSTVSMPRGNLGTPENIKHEFDSVLLGNTPMGPEDKEKEKFFSSHNEFDDSNLYGNDIPYPEVNDRQRICKYDPTARDQGNTSNQAIGPQGGARR